MIRVHYQRSITTMLLCTLLLLNCQPQPGDPEEDASPAGLPQAADVVLSGDRNGLDDPYPGSPLPMPLGSAAASPAGLPQAADVVLSGDRNGLDDSSPGSPLPMPLGSAAAAPLPKERATRPHAIQPLDESGPSASMHQVVVPAPALAFGQEAWAQYFEEVGEAPPLPKDITAILDSPCPFWEGQRVRDTHLLTLIPAKVGGRDFSLNLLEELIMHPQNDGHRAQYDGYTEDTKRRFGAIAPSSSYWMLMTRDVLPGSRSLTDTEQSSFVTGHATRTGLRYALPTTLEATTIILMHHTRTGECLFTNNPGTYTRCHEFVGPNPEDNPSNRRYMYVGNFSARGLLINSCLTGTGMGSYILYAHGVAVCRKL